MKFLIAYFAIAFVMIAVCIHHDRASCLAGDPAGREFCMNMAAPSALFEAAYWPVTVMVYIGESIP